MYTFQNIDHIIGEKNLATFEGNEGKGDLQIPKQHRGFGLSA